MPAAPSLVDIPDFVETERLFLRPPMPGDAAAMNAAIQESWDDLHRWMPWARERPTPEQTAATAVQLRATFIARTDFPMWALLHDQKTIVGATGLHRFDLAVPRFEIGYWVRRGCQRQGYATEIVLAMARVALATLRAERVEIHCSHRNEASQRTALRCGFTLEGRLRNQSREPTGELRDTVIYSLLRNDAAAQALLHEALARPVL